MEFWGYFAQVILTIIALAISSSVCSDVCHQGLPSLAKFLATKTPYSFVAELSTKNLSLDPRCSPVQFWMLARHGTRYPSKSGLIAIKDVLPAMAKDIRKSFEDGKTEICENLLNRLEKWKPDLSIDMSKKLHAEGELEMILLAERYQTRFPNLLSSDYHPEYFTFRATDTQRSIQSQKFFAHGLFGRRIAQEVKYMEPAQPHDPLIRSYKVCSRWQKEVKKNPKSLEQQKHFETSELFKRNVLEPVGRRLGFARSLSLNDIDALYNGCVFGQAWKPSEKSPWCDVFTDDELLALEYREDLEYFHVDGYGNELNGKSACVLVKDIIENFENITKGREDEEKAVLYFSHSGAVLKLVSFLGLFYDSLILTHDKFDELKHNRAWRTSLFNSFGSNVAFVLSKCKDDEFRVGVFMNEKLLTMPGCEKEGLWCDLQTFKDIFLNRMGGENCDLHELCSLGDELTDNEILQNVPDDRF